jgi:hypothetical protein
VFKLQKKLGMTLSSILGVGCGAPVNFADIKEGEVVVDIGSGAGIDVFLAANKGQRFSYWCRYDRRDVRKGTK